MAALAAVALGFSFTAYAQTGELGADTSLVSWLVEHLGLPGVLAYLALRGTAIPVRLTEEDRSLLRGLAEAIQHRE